MPTLGGPSIVHGRPNNQLIVKVTFDRYNKRITFSSARNCSYELLRLKIEQSFSLQNFSFCIAYKDDDGEVTDITNEADLTEAIHYFQAGDDPPLSSAQSILSGRSFERKKITLRVSVTVDYDGPSLSDTSSLASLDEYKNRSSNGSSLSLSMGSSVQLEQDDDSVTVSSRDMIGRPNTKTTKTVVPMRKDMSDFDLQSLSDHPSEPSSSIFNETRFPENTSVFERLKLINSSESVERNNQWLREQSSRKFNAVMATESVSDGSSLSLGEDFEAHSPFEGDLALQQDNGKYYYTYTSGSSSASAANDDFDLLEEESQGIPELQAPKLNWVASRSTMKQNRISRIKSTSYPSTSSSGRQSMSMSSDCCPINGDSGELPPEVKQFVQEHPQPPSACTECSACGAWLDSFRYVCSTCGEKPAKPYSTALSITKGKARDDPFRDPFSYPPLPRHRANRPTRPLPSLPFTDPLTGISTSSVHSSSNGSSGSSGSAASSKTLANSTPGYELCPNCFQTEAIVHALEVSTPNSNESEPVSPISDVERSQRHRKAPQKGQFRHAFMEKMWSTDGWKDVEQDDDVLQCKTCSNALRSRRYKCASCEKFVLCRVCYSKVHEIHPMHAFLELPDRPVETESDSDLELASTLVDDSAEEGSLIHPDVKCAHCLMEIVGARFHCAICDSIDICQNCEAAGLPGNLNAEDGGHISSHIMIKIPIPLNSAKVQTASRRARQLWTGRDAENVRRSIINDIDTRTVIGFGVGGHSHSLSSNRSASSVGGGAGKAGVGILDHCMTCANCSREIIGVRYQCASCPAPKMQSYNLCADCEQISYGIHNPMHIFFKLNRPVDRPIESDFPLVPELYKIPAGPQPANRNGSQAGAEDPRGYLSSLLHTAALCDHCVEQIHGEWFRCAHCSKDLCDACEALSAHEPTHVFYVFKAPVDMPMFRVVAELDNQDGPRPVLKNPVYYS